MGGRALGFVALGVFVAAWFVPVHDGLGSSAYGADYILGFERSTPPGWRACETAWEMLLEDEELKTRILGSTCLTNLLMIVAIVLVITGVRVRLLGALLLLCAVLNAGWVYLNVGDGEFVAGLQIGYYLWTASFGLMGVAFLAR